MALPNSASIASEAPVRGVGATHGYLLRATSTLARPDRLWNAKHTIHAHSLMCPYRRHSVRQNPTQGKITRVTTLPRPLAILPPPAAPPPPPPPRAAAGREWVGGGGGGGGTCARGRWQCGGGRGIPGDSRPSAAPFAARPRQNPPEAVSPVSGRGKGLSWGHSYPPSVDRASDQRF